MLDVLVGLLGVVVAAAAVYVAYKQLSRMVDGIHEAIAANRTASLMAVLSIEQMIVEARVRFEDANHALEKNGADPALIELQETRREQYLNAIDRLCACIRNGHVDEAEYKADFRDTIFELVDTYAALFAANTNHRHIKHVHDAWKAERPALQPAATQRALKA